MTIIDISVLIIASLFAIYGLASAVECGIVLKMLGRDKPSRAMFTPLWEITNVYLVFGITAMAMLFNGALTRLSSELMTTIGLALGVMLARACLVLGIFYIKDEHKISNWLLRLFAVATFMVPLAFTSAGVYLLTGSLFYETLLGVALMLAALVGLAGSGLVFINRREKQRSVLPGELVLSVWFLILGCVVPLIITHTTNSLAQPPILGLVGVSGLGLAIVLAHSMGQKQIKLWQYAAFAVLVVPILLAWANRPFLISGKLSLASAFGAETYANAIVIGMVIMLPIILFGSWLFVRLLRAPA